MSTSEPLHRRRRFAKRARHRQRAVVPGRAARAGTRSRGQLGVNEVNFAIRTTGLLGLVLLVLSLVVTPLRTLTGWSRADRDRGATSACSGSSYLATHFVIFFWFDRAGQRRRARSREIIKRVYLWFGIRRARADDPARAHVDRRHGHAARREALEAAPPARLRPIAIAGVVHYYLLVKSDMRQPLAFAVVRRRAARCYRVVAHYVDLRASSRRRARTKLAATPRRHRR